MSRNYNRSRLDIASNSPYYLIIDSDRLLKLLYGY
jgi:hypothetical protein